MRIEGTHRGRTGLAIALAALAVTGISLTTWYLVSEADCSVNGGHILSQEDGSIRVRCLSPDVSLHLNNFSGTIEFTNCFPDAQVEGYDGEVVRNGTRLSFSVSDDTEELKLTVPDKESFKFAVLGDGQGKNDILARILDSLDGCDFVIHCGDLTPSGADSEFRAVEEVLNASGVPVFTTPGNHDARLGELGAYVSRFGPADYSFTYSGLDFVFVDSSDLSITEEELERAKEAFGDSQRKIMVTHVPSYDPFGANHTLDAASCDRVQAFALENGLAGVYSGHVHAFYILEVEGTEFLISGGAGGTLVDGVHHHVVVTAGGPDLTYEKVDLINEWEQSPYVTLMGRGGEVVNLTFSQLMDMDFLTAYSSYENLYGNTGGQGTYSGPSVASLIALVGGMVEGDTLRVVGSDGYDEEFGYLNVYPDSDWLALQGNMMVAMEHDGETPPDWEDGPRLAFLAPDGLYSNSDCEATSYEDQGYFLYPSAGARWVRFVASIIVEAGT
jgi:predicted phosphodiesterase